MMCDHGGRRCPRTYGRRSTDTPPQDEPLRVDLRALVVAAIWVVALWSLALAAKASL